jgi:hypothetical protein
MLSNLLIKLLAAVSFAYYLVEVYGLGWKIKRMLKRDGRVKPFDCLYCMSAWMGLLFYSLPTAAAEITLAMFGAALLSNYLK